MANNGLVGLIETWKAAQGVEHEAWEVFIGLDGDRGTLSLNLLIDAPNAHDALESARKELPEDWETYWTMTSITVKLVRPWTERKRV